MTHPPTKEIQVNKEMRDCAREIVNTESQPPLDECYGKDPVVPIQAWLSAKALAAFTLGQDQPDEREAKFIKDADPFIVKTTAGEWAFLPPPGLPGLAWELHTIAHELDRRNVT
jgi:hypothetical protein